MLKSPIEAKQQAERDALRMSFILQKEKQEAERKRIEAQGIGDFQKIAAAGISAQLLEWNGIGGHGEAGGECECQGGDHWQSEEWVTASAGAEIRENPES